MLWALPIGLRLKSPRDLKLLMNSHRRLKADALFREMPFIPCTPRS